MPTYPLSTALVPGATGRIANFNQVNAKLNSWADAEADFGAAGNGTADETTAILNALGSGQRAKLRAHNYKVTGQVALNTVGQVLEGDGFRTQLLAQGTMSSALSLGASRIRVADIYVRPRADGILTVAGISIDMPGTSNEEDMLERVWVINDLGGAMVNAIAIAPVTHGDVSEVHLRKVTGSRASNAGLLIGDLTPGNVLNARVYDGIFNQNLYGVLMQGATASISGGTMQANTGADVYLKAPNTSPVSIKNIRSENSYMFWLHDSGDIGGLPIDLEGIDVSSFTRPDGYVVYHQGAMVLNLTKSYFKGNTNKRTVTDLATTSGSDIVTSASAAFSAAGGAGGTDVDKVIDSPNLPPGTLITTVDSPTQVHVSNNATVTGSSTATIRRGAKVFVQAFGSPWFGNLNCWGCVFDHPKPFVGSNARIQQWGNQYLDPRTGQLFPLKQPNTGPIIVSPNGTEYQLRVDNTGAVTGFAV